MCSSIGLRDNCVSSVGNSQSLDITDCVYSGGAAKYITISGAGNVAVRRGTAKDLTAAWNTVGGFIYWGTSTGWLEVDSCVCLDSFAGIGMICFQGAESVNTATIVNCSFINCRCEFIGCIAGLETPWSGGIQEFPALFGNAKDTSLTVYVRQCSFLNYATIGQYTSYGDARNGAIAGHQPFWHIEDCIFSHCTLVSRGDGGKAQYEACFIRIQPKSTLASVELYIRNCTMNNDKNATGNSQNCITFWDNYAKNSLLEISDVYLNWEAPQTAFSFGTLIAKDVLLVKIRNFTIFFGVKVSSVWYLVEAATTRAGHEVSFVDCKFSSIHQNPDSVRGIRANGKVEISRASFENEGGN
jgi:hypothetical protein